MKKLFPDMFDRPEKTLVMAGFIYSFIAFYSFPFLTLFFAQGFNSAASLSWFEIVYHGVNFLVVAWLFREYLKESFFNFRYDIQPFLIVCGCCAAASVIYATCITFQGFVGLEEQHHFVAESALPLVPVELFNLSVNLVAVNNIAGVICVVIFAPLVISCLYYAIAFAPVCNSRPWLAYIVMAIVVAIPRVCHILNHWAPKAQIMLYFAQLPLHFIACYSYQKTDTVWAPIAVHTVTNIVACVMVLWMASMV